MSGLTNIEKQKLERELQMSGGSILNFSNRTFEEFFREVVGIQIYDLRYNRGSGSKAHRTRAFWDVATEKQLRLFFAGLVEGWSIYSNVPISSSGQVLLQQIQKKLDRASPIIEPQQNSKSATSIGEEVSQKLVSGLRSFCSRFLPYNGRAD